MSRCATPYPPFSWSHSRAATLATCARAYRHAYYTAHRGWEPGAPADARAAFRLKQLTSLFAVLGLALHERAREIAIALLAGRDPPSLETLRRRTRAALNHAVRTSRARDAFRRAPARVPMTADAYYGRPLSAAVVRRIAERLERCTYFLHTCPLWGELGDLTPSDIVLVERPASFLLDGVTVYVAPDLLYRHAGRWTIVDWKTGSTEGAADQLALYALFVEHGMGVPDVAGRLEARVFALETGMECRHVVTAAALDAALARVRRSVAAMRGYLLDPGANAPKPLAAFPLTADRARCRACRFLELCWPVLTAGACSGGTRAGVATPDRCGG